MLCVCVLQRQQRPNDDGFASETEKGRALEAVAVPSQVHAEPATADDGVEVRTRHSAVLSLAHHANRYAARTGRLLLRRARYSASVVPPNSVAASTRCDVSISVCRLPA